MRHILIIFIMLVSIPSFAKTKVLMMIPNDFWWTEYSVPYEMYKKAGYSVTTASKLSKKVNPDLRNKKTYPKSRSIKADITFDKVNVDDYDAITFVAGNGAWHDYFPNQRVHDIVQNAFKKKKVVGLLCASTGLLGMVNNWDGKSPIAKGKKAVGYFRVEGLIKKLGQVDYVPGGKKEPGAIIDGNLVTGRNPQSSEIFAKKIIERLSKLKK